MYYIKKNLLPFFFTSAIEFLQAFPSVFTAPLFKTVKPCTTVEIGVLLKKMLSLQT